MAGCSGAAVVLAAGASRRMGRPKPLIPYGTSTFLETILQRVNAARVSLGWRGVVSSTASEPLLRELCARHDWPTLINMTPETGPLGSIRMALKAGGETWSWLMVCLADQPGISEETYRSMLSTACALPDKLVVPSFRGQRGHPVIFPRKCFADLMAAPLDQGAKWVVSRHKHERVEVETEDPEVLRETSTLRKICSAPPVS